MRIQEFAEAPEGAKKSFLDPRTKLILLVVVNTVMMGGVISGLGALIRPLLALIPLLLLLTERRWKAGALYAPLVLFASLGEAILVPSTTGLTNLLVIVATGIISRFLPSLVMGYYVITTTTVSELVAALERMKVPRGIVIPLVVMLRFLPTVVEEARAISDAMRLRGLSGAAVLRNPIAAIEYRIVPLIAGVVRIGEDLSAAALTRGLGAPVKRTNICRIGLGWIDLAFASAAIAAMALIMLPNGMIG